MGEVRIPLFARFFGVHDRIRMHDPVDDSYLRVNIDYIYEAFKTRFLAELKAEGYRLVKTDE